MTTQLATLGSIGRLGRWSARRWRLVLTAWAVLVVGFGAVAPRAEHALSGGGWQADRSESVRAREVIERHFGGMGSSALVVVISSHASGVGDPGFARAVAASEALLRRDSAVRAVVGPRRGETISADGHVAVLRAAAGVGAEEMVRAADRVRDGLRAVSEPGVSVELTGSPALWAQFNSENKAAMLRSEVLSWPLTLAVLAMAFGSLAAAGIPLLLAIAGLVATAGALWLGTKAIGISIWAMNFALMFALAVGIDYALFVVVRFRAALRAGRAPLDAVAETMDTAGKTVLASGLAVLASLSAVMLVPSQPFRTSALGILLAVAFVLAASLTLLPAVLARLGTRVDRYALPWASALGHRSGPFARWGRLIWRRPVVLGAAAAAVLVVLALPATALRTAMPTTGVLPGNAPARVGYERLQRAFGPGATAELQVVGDARDADRAVAVARRDRGVAVVGPTVRRGALAMTRVVPVDGAGAGGVIDRLRAQAPSGTLVGGTAAEAHDLEHVLAARTPIVYGLVLLGGFLLLLLVVRAPVAAAVAVGLNLAATAAAFGVAKLVFQDGVGASLLGLEPQGFVDAWAPVFFFCLIFALAMDYTTFLLATAREELERTGDARQAVVEGLARSGRVINAAGTVMVVVFFTFALTGPLAPKEMGVILGVAVLLDTLLIRLLLLPAALRLLGPWAWWTPSLVERWVPAVSLRHA